MCAERIHNIVNIYGLKPQYKERFDKLINGCSLESQECHTSYKYPVKVKNQKCWAHVGVFYNYLIKRELYVLCKMEAVDKRAELFESVLKKNRHQIRNHELEVREIEDWVRISIDSGNIDEVEDFLHSYKIFKNTAEYRTKDVLEHVFKTSMFYMMAHGRPTVPYDRDFLNRSNVKDVLKFVKSWNLQGIKINPTVGSELFTDDAGFIFHDSIMDIRVSKHEPDEKRSSFNRGIYKMIFYALGHYSETGLKMRKLKVYNPLLGKMYILKFKRLHFNSLLLEINNDICWNDDSDDDIPEWARVFGA